MFQISPTHTHLRTITNHIHHTGSSLIKRFPQWGNRFNTIIIIKPSQKRSTIKTTAPTLASMPDAPSSPSYNSRALPFYSISSYQNPVSCLGYHDHHDHAPHPITPNQVIRFPPPSGAILTSLSFSPAFSVLHSPSCHQSAHHLQARKKQERTSLWPAPPFSPFQQPASRSGSLLENRTTRGPA
ncbi:hypothetical protein CCM_02663 [Cordyceps militaris CM01]|uniref:Uncharacterized protein n=1 Tax=Cordyceps militaris (strain CM01) TaxID=983644 RepID=G3JB32_CORMM|nr:uncharacterized protein CCM_02663 [Cordyceps militaris CM01]EGX94392.1 hypothetical protein CCM_02663 [Cordyceps militaris CM01]